MSHNIESQRSRTKPVAGRSSIEGVYLLTHRYYVRLTQLCVASIRHWYPEIPIYLIKDKIAGDFSTREIETSWNVQVFPTEAEQFGWGFAHLEPLLMPERRRILVMDVDIVFVGRVLDFLANFEEDFIVHQEDQPENPTGKFSGLYFSLEKLRRWDPSFRFPRYSFNAGQFVATSGILRREDFDGLIDWGSPRSVLLPEIFNRGDQGVLNYVMMKKHMAGAISLARVPFMVWNPDEMKQFDLARLTAESPYAKLIHWAGLRKPRMCDMPRADILQKFEQLYYSKVPLGRIKRSVRPPVQCMANFVGKVAARFTKRQPNLYLT